MRTTTINLREITTVAQPPSRGVEYRQSNNRISEGALQ